MVDQEVVVAVVGLKTWGGGERRRRWDPWGVGMDRRRVSEENCGGAWAGGFMN